MDSFKNIPSHQQAEFSKYMEEQQMKESLMMYNHLVEGCFDKCVGVGSWSGNFASKTLNDGETKCISNCSQKFLKLTQRVGYRFAEYQAQKAQEGQQQP
mmetsp:Transcript_24704/g.41771  ORF Transcript_24704/g.41771 Transcript_24704/m.41771 type:complete len:99 (+) Transcript_24704:43-339(+)